MLPACHAIARKYQHRIHDPAVTVDDLAQVAMLGVLKAARLYDGRGGWPGYAGMQAEYVLSHFVRDHRGPGARSRLGPLQVVASLDAPHPANPDVTLGDALAVAEDVEHEDRLSLAPALARLTGRERALLTAHVVGGVSQGEIAGGPGTGQVRVSREIRRALARLRSMSDVQSLAA